ncbi:MAG: antitoxin [Thermoleophilia bacterium]
MSLTEEDVDFLDAYAARHDLRSRSAAMHEAIRALRLANLTAAYEGAWSEWESSDDADLWEATVGDGL